VRSFSELGDEYEAVVSKKGDVNGVKFNRFKDLRKSGG